MWMRGISRTVFAGAGGGGGFVRVEHERCAQSPGDRRGKAWVEKNRPAASADRLSERDFAVNLRGFEVGLRGVYVGK